jgi:hypothetical protein
MCCCAICIACGAKRGRPDDWNLADADPAQAATTRAMAIWEIAETANDQEYAVLERLSELCAQQETS